MEAIAGCPAILQQLGVTAYSFAYSPCRLTVVVISSLCESVGLCFHRCWFVCLSVYLSVTTITKKIVDRFVPNFTERFQGGKGRPSLCFVTIGREMWK